MTSSRSLLAQALDRPGVRVRTLVQLRWAAIAGQLATLLIVGLLLGFPIPWPSALAAVGASISLNLGLAWLYRRRDRLEGASALLHLAFDLAQLSVLLFLTGGLANPFALLLLVPVTISATLLSARATALLVAGALGLLVILWQWSLPLPWRGVPLELPDMYRVALLIAIALGMVFLSLYAWQVSAEARRRQAALVATQAALERESRMAALGSLAAAAAHELGGPLGTITLVARDLESALGNDPDFGADIHLLNQEARRSRDILAGIAERAEAEDPFPFLPLPALLHEVVEPFEPTRVPVTIGVMWEPGGGPAVRRSPELLHGLNNLLSNALRHARSAVRLEAGEDSADFWVAITDDGHGFDPALLPRLGEPFLGPSWSGSGSTGLGIFIATTLLERTGARLSFANMSQGGARVELRWERAHIEGESRMAAE
ncbi:ActS/PrrB/RegB family redox-sensitive histidine kinase [Sandaracinobacteroides saxicola]|uniref:histidine kinase n=1 Tax=Sandaracinobacteroides saxicola TaxID=2759707 RepID=A0A7G5IG99_9SPHN|nr:ActS/PrrB/RegB family redox-sensitive histidine kinase [Sandaracinobacteroides saxicola]QMW22391.1 ActS/PrrB/RegB family redox-sensitive histidine kinase [Sandaracinobacteroides saxicola]